MTWLGIVRRITAVGLLAAMASGLPWHGSVLAQAPGLALVIATNQSVFGAGTTLDVTLGVESGASSGAVDLYFGAILPDGDSVVFFEGAGLAARTGRLSQPASLRPMFASLGLGPGATVVIPDFFRYRWQGNEPFGPYQLFFAATRPNALRDGRIDGGDLVALQTSTVAFAPPASITVDPARSSSAQIPIGGGTVQATATDGTTYSLSVPAGALARTTTVTLTPVTALTGLPSGLTVVSAVRAEPQGLAFAVPATLSMALPPGTNPARVVGFTTTDTGAGVQFLPADSTGASEVQVTNVAHFSVIGAAIPATTGELPPSGSGSSSTFALSIMFTPNDHAALEPLFISWFDTIVRPMLIAGRDDVTALPRAMAEYLTWEANRVLRQPDVTLPLAELQSEAGKVRVAQALRLAMERRNAECLAGRNLVRAEEVLRLQSLGASYFDELTFPLMVPNRIPAPLPRFENLEFLDLATVLTNLCVSVDILGVTLPAIIQPGVTTPLTVRAGLAMRDGGLPLFAPPLQIRVDAVGAAPTQQVGQTNATGDFATTFTPTGAGLTLGILAAFTEPINFPYLSLATLTDTATAGGVGAVVVSPNQPTIAAGASRQFAATVAGTANQAVTWAVSGGGTISATGLFTSNGTLGTFFVTATSVADPSVVGIAQVTVGGTPTGALVRVDNGSFSPGNPPGNTLRMLALQGVPPSPVGFEVGCGEMQLPLEVANSEGTILGRLLARGSVQAVGAPCIRAGSSFTGTVPSVTASLNASGTTTVFFAGQVSVRAQAMISVFAPAGTRFRISIDDTVTAEGNLRSRRIVSGRAGVNSLGEYCLGDPVNPGNPIRAACAGPEGDTLSRVFVLDSEDFVQLFITAEANVVSLTTASVNLVVTLTIEP